MNFNIVVIIILLLIGNTCSFAGFNSSRMNNQITKTISQNISRNISNYMIPRLKVKNSSGEVNGMYISNSGYYLVSSFLDNTIRVWDLEKGVQRPFIKKILDQPVSRLDEKRELIYTAHDLSIIGYEIQTGKEKVRWGFEGIKKINTFSFVKNKEALLVNDSGLNFFNLSLSKKLWSRENFEGDIKEIASNEILNKWALLIRKESVFSSSDWIEIGDLKTGKSLYRLENNGKKIIFFSLVESQLKVGYSSGDVVYFDISSGNKTVEIVLPHDSIRLMDISTNKISYINDGDIVVTDINQVSSYTVNKERIDASHIAIISDKNKLLVADNQGRMLFFDLLAKKNTLELISTTNGWTVIDKLGRFDSSEKGIDNVSWEVENTEIPLDGFSKNYYEPGLLSSYLKNNGFINLNPENILNGIPLPPIVTLSNIDENNNNVTLHLAGKGNGGGLKEMYLYHNGKIKKTKVFTAGTKQDIDFEINLSVGKNVFQAVAINSLGIEGKSEKIIVHLKGDKKPPIIHIVSIGINEYRDPSLNLNYSVADANSIAKIVLGNNVSKYGRVKHQKLNNKDATKENILNYLGNVTQFSQDDILIIYAAGHGVAIDKKWYFLPYETVRQKKLSSYTSIGISAKEIKEILSVNKAQKVFVIIDSCFSSAGLDAFRDLQNTQRHFSRDLSKSVGVVVLTSARFNQEAAESPDIGHGLFTYIVSLGMEGGADKEPRNEKISAHEIVDFTVENLPSFSTKYLKEAQEPSAFIIGSDFELLNIVN